MAEQHFYSTCISRHNYEFQFVNGAGDCTRVESGGEKTSLRQVYDAYMISIVNLAFALDDTNSKLDIRIG